MDKYYKKFSLYLCNNNFIKLDDCKVYEYAMKVFIHSFINVILTICIGIFFGMVKECMCLFLTIFTLRKFTGGLHTDKYIHCLISSIVLIILSLLLIKHLGENTKLILFFVLTFISTILIWIFSPIDNKNKKLSDKEKKVYKYFSMILS